MPESEGPMVRCECCEGTGRVRLTGVYHETWELLRRQGSRINGAALAKLDGCKATAMNNRLVRLEELGLARSEWHGRERLWEANDADRG